MLHPEKILIDGRRLADGCERTGFVELPMFNCHAFELETLSRPDDSPRHNDPFDRMLIAQAKYEDMVFLTHDSLLMDYNEPCVEYV